MGYGFDSMGEQLRVMFSEDRLYQFCQRPLGYSVDEIVDEYMESLHENLEYPTTQFEEWYCDESLQDQFLAARSTMRHWMGELDSYIMFRKPGRNVVMDYRAVFRLRLALLMRKKNVKLNKVQELVGISPSLVEEVEEKSISPNSSSNHNPGQTEMLLGMLLKTGLFVFDEAGLAINTDYIKTATGQSLSLPGTVQLDLEELREKTEEQDRKLNEMSLELGRTSEINEETIKRMQEEFESKVRAIRENELNSIFLKRRVEKELQDEAMAAWAKLPEVERLKKVGLFRKDIDLEKQMRFISEYVNEHFERVMKDKMQ